MNGRKILLGFLDAAVKIAFVIVVIMLISKYAKLAYSYGYQIFNQTAVSSGTGRTVSFTVKSGDSVDDIAENLAGLGLITDKRLFKLQEKFSEFHDKEKPGTYELSTAMTPEEMLTVMAGGLESAGDEDGMEIGADMGIDTGEETGEDAGEDAGDGAGDETDGG